MFIIANRVVKEIISDRRTIGLILFAPILLLTLMNVVFSASYRVVDIGYVDTLPETIYNEEVNYVAYSTYESLEVAILEDEVDGGLVLTEETKQFNYMNQVVSVPNTTYDIILHGDDPILDPYVQSATMNSLNLENSMIESEQLVESFDLNDYLIVYLMQFVIFFFSFLTVGVAFLRERNENTLNRMLTFNISKLSIVLGYLIGFGIIAIFQTTLIELYSIYVLDLTVNGSIILSIFANFIYSFVAISLGAFISSLAKSEFQIMQFIPIIIIPQLIFANIFPFGRIYEMISHLFPITYGFEIQRNILLYGEYDIIKPIIVLIGFTFLLCGLTVMTLKKIRNI